MHIASAIAILIGCFIIVKSSVQALRLRPYLTTPRYLNAWKVAGILALLFVIGYLAAALGVLLSEPHSLFPLVAGLLLGGAVFVHLITTAAASLVTEVVKDPAQQSKPKNDQTSQAPTESQSEPPPVTPEIIDKRLLQEVPQRSARIRKYSGTFRIDQKQRHPTEPGQEQAIILVVEDSQINRTILDSYIERLGHRSILVGDGKSALSILATNNSIELVLLDYWLPDMEGIEILDVMKSGEHADTPVLMLSSEEDSETIARCIEAGADDFLAKPFAPRLLRARIEASLAKRRFRMSERQFMARLEQERKRADELLQVILPTPIAQELTTTNRVKPRRYEHVAVLFADISGFTAYCDKHRPEDVLSHLQSIVIAFENLAEQHSVQKIKTIGDSFMAACGLLHEVEDPVLRCVELGMDMIKVVEAAVPEWDLRIGVHIGPVVAGIVGRSQFLFDIWGDTVNTASRIETNAMDNGICVSKEAWAEISAKVEGQSLGLVHAKGKGDIEIFRVDGLRAIPSVMKIEQSTEHSYTVH